MGAATSVILLTSVIFNVDTARGGLSFDAFGKPTFDGKTGGFFSNGIELTLAPRICDTVLKYSSKYRWANNFVPSGPQDINYGLMNLALQSISYYKKLVKRMRFIFLQKFYIIYRLFALIQFFEIINHQNNLNYSIKNSNHFIKN